MTLSPFVQQYDYGYRRGGAAPSATYGGGAAPSSGGGSVFPLAVHASGRYLVNASGAPFRLTIDAGWLMCAHSSTTTQNAYLAWLVSSGRNGFILMNYAHRNGGAWVDVNEPNDLQNVPPFTTPGNLTTPNTTYFAKISNMIDRALALGLVVMFFHSYLGDFGGNQGWEQEIKALTNAQAFTYGQFLATTFTQPNIIWMHGGDDFLSDATALARYQQIVAGIQSVTRNRLASSEWLSPDSITQEQSGFAYGLDPATSDMQINWIYGTSGGPTHGSPNLEGALYYTVDYSLHQSTFLPVALGEVEYSNFQGTREDIRSAHWWGTCAGAVVGANYGETDRWDWLEANVIASFGYQGTTENTVFNTFWNGTSACGAVRWWDMRPSGTSTSSPVKGAGTYGTTYCGRTLITSTNSLGSGYIAACMSGDGSQLVAYVPPTGTNAKTFTVDLQSMSGTGTAYWYNVLTGARTTIGTVANTGTQSFTTPGNNTDQNDWVLFVSVPT